MVLADTPIEVQTPYGKLAVPARDLLKIDFGVHLPDGAEKQIEQAIAELGNENFRVREAASVTLTKYGASALPALVEATKSTDLELSKRAKALVAKMHQEAQTAGKEFRTQTMDTITTPTFTVVGKILTSTIKAKAEYVGTMECSLVDMRSLRSTETPNEVNVTVDGRYAAQGQQEWVATEFVFDGRSKLVIAATGQIDLFPQNGAGDQFVSTPKGNFNGGGGVFIGGGKGGAHARPPRHADRPDRRNRRPVRHRRRLRGDAGPGGEAVPAGGGKSLEQRVLGIVPGQDFDEELIDPDDG